MAKLRVVVSVADDHRARLHEVATAAEQAGMSVERKLGSIGIFSGAVDATKLAALRQVAGVANVEEERDVGLYSSSGKPS